MTLNPDIFKAYDIRGIYGRDFNLEDTQKIAKAFARFSGANKVVVGRDMRSSSEELSSAVIEGLLSHGAEVVNIGLCSTPMFNFAVASKDTHQGGIMITASHNPAEYNGFKLSLADALPVGKDSGMEEIKRLVLADNFRGGSQGQVTDKDILDGYLDKVFSLVDVQNIKPLKVVVDAGNGMGGMVAPPFFKRLKNCQLIQMYFELDGSFPNHEANPIKEENIADLKKRVVAEQADLGIAYDADGDRIGFVDERGHSISGDLIAGLLAVQLLKKHPGELILYDVRCSNIVKEKVAEAGGRSRMSMVGHALIKKLMKETNALFAGEFSSHFYYRDFYSVESDELTALLMMRIISAAARPFSEVVGAWRKYFHSGEINSKVKDKQAMISKIKKMYSARAESVSEIDGIRIDFKDWWFNLRASNTEPLLRLIVEAKIKELMEKKRDEILNIIRERET